ncbi:MAG: hypothetical protein GXO25_03055 [Euryarchaeota archaeon]|nr:hypothetical protein [Euryarchaeota archaeon]
MGNKSYMLEKTLVILSLFILLVPGALAGAAQGPAFHEVKKLNMNVRVMAFNSGAGLIYAGSSRTLYVLNSETYAVEKKIGVLSSFPAVYHITGVGYDSGTGKLYIAAWPDKVVVLNAQNYQTLKVIKTTSPGKLYEDVSNVYVDTHTDMIYVKVLNESGNYAPMYAVINGKNDTLSGFIDYGALYFAHNELWVWTRSIKNFTLQVRSLSDGNVKREITVPVSQLNGSWENPKMLVFSSLLYIHPAESADVLVYDLNSYSLVHHWKNASLAETTFSAYDAKYNVLFGIHGTPVNFTAYSVGLVAVNASTGRTVARLDNITITSLYGGGTLKVLGFDSSGYLYASVQKDANSTATLEVYEFSASSAETPTFPMEIIIGVLIAVAVAAVVVYAVKVKGGKK